MSYELLCTFIVNDSAEILIYLLWSPGRDIGGVKRVRRSIGVSVAIVIDIVIAIAITVVDVTMAAIIAVVSITVDVVDVVVVVYST